MLLSTDLVLGLVALSFVPFVAWRSSVTQLRLRATWLELQERLSVLTRVMEENLSGIRVVRAFASQAYELLKFDKASHNALELAHKRVGIRVDKHQRDDALLLCCHGSRPLGRRQQGGRRRNYRRVRLHRS